MYSTTPEFTAPRSRRGVCELMYHTDGVKTLARVNSRGRNTRLSENGCSSENSAIRRMRCRTSNCALSNHALSDVHFVITTRSSLSSSQSSTQQ